MPRDFWCMTFVDYLRLCIYKAKQEYNEWDRTRVLMSYILNTQVEKKHQKKPKEILPMPFDKLNKVKPKGTIKTPTQEEKEEMLKRVSK